MSKKVFWYAHICLLGSLVGYPAIEFNNWGFLKKLLPSFHRSCKFPVHHLYLQNILFQDTRNSNTSYKASVKNPKMVKWNRSCLKILTIWKWTTKTWGEWEKGERACLEILQNCFSWLRPPLGASCPNVADWERCQHQTIIFIPSFRFWRGGAVYCKEKRRGLWRSLQSHLAMWNRCLLIYRVIY